MLASRNTRQSLFVTAVVAGWTLISGASRAATYLQPADVGTFNGRTWSGITLGESTQKALKKQYRTDRSPYEHALQISQPKGSPVRIHALCAGKEQPVTAVVLRYEPAGIGLDALRTSMASDPSVYHPRSRYEDWRVGVWPEKGVVAFILASPQGEQVPLIALARPAEVRLLTSVLTADETPVSTYVDPHAGEPKVMRFGEVDLDFSVRGMLLNEDRERLLWEDRMRRATAGGTMDFDIGASGTYTARVTGNWDPKKGGTVTVNASISGMGPYGAISSAGYASESLPKAGRNGSQPSQVSTSYTRAVTSALRQAEQSFEKKMRATGPPPIETFRLADWDRAVEQLRGLPPS